MSGIVGIFNLNGAPVDARLLQNMTEFLAFRGPDAHETWMDGPIGFGHAMLRTTREAERERQPANLREDLWITADARVDARDELIPQLRAKGKVVPDDAPDSTLILLAYDVWGEDCIEHLLGDFAFAIWDGARRQLFCARDHFGVKPFFYAQAGGCLVFSNTLGCVRLHPGISDRLNDLAIADFLLFDSSQDLSTSVFADIQRLPPAHSLVCRDGKVRLRKYWSVPIEEPIRYARAAEYVDHFRALFEQAVRDRLRVSSAGVFMSGGLDSTAVAATARQVLAQRGGEFDLRAYTAVYDSLFPDVERPYAALAAQHLAMPIYFQALDGYHLYERCESPECRMPEPSHDPLIATKIDLMHTVANHHRVVLTGQGADPLFSASLTTFLRGLLRRRRFAEAARALTGYFGAEGRFSRLYLSTRWRVLRGKTGQADLPEWLQEKFVARLDLRSRWRIGSQAPPSEHPHRPHAHQIFQRSVWPYILEAYDVETASFTVEVRHPYFDVRLLRYVLRLQVLPWCSDKEMLRAFLKGSLPDRIRLRRKTPLVIDPFFARVAKGELAGREHLPPSEMLANYVDASRVPSSYSTMEPVEAWINLRPYSLGLWLRSLAHSTP